MDVRVHELAKELKISTGALKKHLKDLGIEVKSHMSHLEDEDANRVRALFQQERDSNRKREEERRKYFAARVKEKQQARERELAEKRAAKAKELAEKEEAKKALEEMKKAKPTFIEKPIEKGTEKQAEKETVAPDKKEVRPKKTAIKTKEEKLPTEIEDHSAQKIAAKKVDEKTEEIPAKKEYRHKPIKKEGVNLPDTPVVPETLTTKKKGVSRHTTDDDSETKPKHIQAKLKHSKRSKKKKSAEPFTIEEAEVKRKIKQTLSKQKKKKYKKEDKPVSEEDNIQAKIVISEFTSVSELAKIMDIPASDIIMKFFKMGKATTINQRLDKESLEMICDEFNFDVTFAQEYGQELLEVVSEKHKDAEQHLRPPIVTVMGHVDHGKTSILDYIRSTNITDEEAGRITQHIGASQVIHNDQKITFLDTPGHEAFTAMRARGAHITDIAVLVVAADDGVKPQTVEAIDHAKASGVEIVVAINKIDLKTANIERVIADLSKHNIYLENYGGEVLWAACSATTGQGIEDLLEAILLAAEMKDLRAKIDIPGSGVVIEARKDSRKGTIATLLLREGTLERGDIIVCGATYGKLRRMEDNKGNRIKTLYPSDVAVVYGLDDVPKGGDLFNKVEDEKIARQISLERKTTRLERERFISRANRENIFARIREKELAAIKIIVKADTDGSVEAFCDAVQKLSNEEIAVTVIHKGVGAIVEADVNLAIASEAMIAGFHVRADNKAKKLAEDNLIEIKTYQIIYEGIDDIKRALEGLIEPDYEEKFVGSAVVKQLFRIKGVGVIAGCAVDKGKIIKDGIVRVFRDTGSVHQGKLSSLKHFAEDVQEVKAGTECGIGIHNFNDIKEGDVIEVYTQVEIPRTL